jgi:hypothetical protein
MRQIRRLSAHMPPLLKAAFAATLSLMAGLAVALIIDYLLYRMGLPGKPFIYVSF